jgi:hypothetical protein
MKETGTPPKAPRQTLTLWPETAQILGLGRNSVFLAPKRGEIQTIRIGRRLLVPRPWLDSILHKWG